MAGSPEEPEAHLEPEAEAPDNAPDGEGSSEPTAEAPPKKRLLRPAKPDEEEFLSQEQHLLAEMQKQKDIMKSITSTLNERAKTTEKREDPGRARLSTLNHEFKTELAKKQQIRGELEAVNKARDAMRAHVKDMKSKMLHTSVEGIDEQIKRAESRISHSSLTLQEERQIIDSIKKLRAARGSVAQYNERIEQLHGGEAVRAQISGKLKVCDERLTAIKGEEETVRAEMNTRRNEAQAKYADTGALIAERNEAREIDNAAYQKLREIRRAHKGVAAAWFREESAWRKQQQEEKAARYAIEKAERDTRNAERRAAAMELAGEPYNKEVTLCEQLETYLQAMAGGSGNKMEEAARRDDGATTSAPPAEGFAGYRALKKKDDREADGMFNLGGGGGKKGKGRKNRGGGGREERGGIQKITHTLDIISAFATLKVDLPLSQAAVPGVMESMQQRKAHFLDLRQKAKAKGVLKLDEEAPGNATNSGGRHNGTAGGGKGGKAPVANGLAKGFSKDQEDWFDVSGNPVAKNAPLRPPEPETVPEADKDTVPELNRSDSISVLLTINNEDVAVQVSALEA